MDVNVDRSVESTNYCYKMALIRVKVECINKELKTIIFNMYEISRALNRPPQYLIEYFGYELGCQAQFNDRNARFTINGSHDATTIQDLLDGFIRKYVLCPKCDHPETKLNVASKERISITCKLCFYYGFLQFQHRLNIFILKNPPELYKEKKLLACRSWKYPPNEQKYKTATITNYFNETSEKDRINIFYEYVGRVKVAKDRMYILHEYTERISAYDNSVYDVATRLEVTQKAPLILAELLFTANILIEIRRYRKLLLHFTHNDEVAQHNLLLGVGQIIALHAEQLIDKVDRILRLLCEYFLDNKVILDWYKSDTLAENIRNKATPFVEWLTN